MSKLKTLADDENAADVSETAAGTGYDRDFFLWTRDQAEALRQGRWTALDIANLVDEVESLGRWEKREIESRVLVLMIHLLKWAYQPDARSTGWRGTIEEQRRRIGMVLRDSPSLKSFPSEILDGEYRVARVKAAGETGLAEETFPVSCPFTIDQVLDEGFFPETD
ncbi:DUF29 domain-containing protein [Jiella marina]|uniref:DUF29 domain-containing protein n=1 Tax=Jiella sp. LLJ827 TaxID=2917712 RepID=UPI002101B70F|nr:DUF29 domain-containing protein [Jiella sp. LLJ827]MCQ0988260.1 DUF29 domain-containing protein [Jiella sp. LLJ827]